MKINVWKLISRFFLFIRKLNTDNYQLLIILMKCKAYKEWETRMKSIERMK